MVFKMQSMTLPVNNTQKSLTQLLCDDTKNDFSSKMFQFLEIIFSHGDKNGN